MNNLVPKLIKVWPDFGRSIGLGRVQAYECAKKMPPGVRVMLGSRVRLDADRLADWMAQGGNLVPAVEPDRITAPPTVRASLKNTK